MFAHIDICSMVKLVLKKNVFIINIVSNLKDIYLINSEPSMIFWFNGII